VFDRGELWRLVTTGRAGSHKTTNQFSECSPSPCWSHRTLPIHISALSYLCYTTTCSWLTLTVCSGAVRRDGISTICVVRCLRLAQRWCWRSKYFGKWHCVVSRTVLPSFIFKAPAVQEERDRLSPAAEGTTRAHRHGAASHQSTWIRAMLVLVLLSVALQRFFFSSAVISKLLTAILTHTADWLVVLHDTVICGDMSSTRKCFSPTFNSGKYVKLKSE